ncbi:MAG TPA: TlpA family protein disulfide reductase [Deltaproteobacteria bacterium]|nr:TlpA family protein disulfide reductase [Deltaproteobacteria bacterium]
MTARRHQNRFLASPARPRILAIVAFVVISLLASALPTIALEAGDRAPAFAAPALGGKGMVELGRYRGKVVYLDFWASWCAPCLTAIPEIEKMRKEFPSRDFQILAVNLDQSERKALRFLKKHPIGYPSASDPKGSLPGQYGVETMPTSYLIDRDGVIRYVHRGFQRGDSAKLRHEIRALLEAK